LKNHFQILVLPPHYTMNVQACIPSALCLVHNVIHVGIPLNEQYNIRYNE
ncbi:hypothetical protein BDR04DRAFT_1037925, partial [Suillus decipiens]